MTKRTSITGTITSIKSQDNGYGPQLKMLVTLDNGHRVFGAAPQAILWEQCEDERGSYAKPVEITGRRVSMMAQIDMKSEDFGIFKRPTKAKLVG